MKYFIKEARTDFNVFSSKPKRTISDSKNTFSLSFATARKAGKKIFTWKNKLYNTKLKNENITRKTGWTGPTPKKRMRANVEYGIAKSRNPNLTNLIRTRNRNKKGTVAYAVAQNKINKAYGSKKVHKVTREVGQAYI